MIRPYRATDQAAVEALLEGLTWKDLAYDEFTGVALVDEDDLTHQVVGFIHGVPGRPYGIVLHFAVVPRPGLSQRWRRLWETLEFVMRALEVPALVILTQHATLTAALGRLGAEKSDSAEPVYLRRL